MENTKSQKSAIETTIEIGELATPVNLPSAVVTYTFQDGRTLRIQTSDLSPEILAYAICHGLKQKVVDAAAIPRDTVTGRAATLDTKFSACEEVVLRLVNEGEWNKTREGGDGAARGGLLVRALYTLYDGRRTVEQLAEYVGTLSKEQQAALRKSPKIAPIIESLRPAKSTTTDADALLAALDDLGSESEGE